MRIIPVTLAIARATDIIRQYPRSLVRFAQSPARSFHSHRLSLIILAAALTQQQADSYIIIPHSQQHRVNKNITQKITLKITLKITQKIIRTLKNLWNLH